MKSITSNSQKFTKNDLIFYYQKYDFPKNLFDKDILKVKEIIFSTESQEPENNQSNKKKIKLANCFIAEEEIEPKKGFFKKPKNAHHKASNDIAPSWRRSEPDDPGFFDDFKGKSDQKQVLTFKRNLELVEKQEMSISIQQSIFLDHFEIQEKGFFDTKKPINAKKQAEAVEKLKTKIQTTQSQVNQNPPEGEKQLTTQTTKEIFATADDLFRDDGIFSNLNINNQNTPTGNIIHKTLLNMQKDLFALKFYNLSSNEFSTIYI